MNIKSIKSFFIIYCFIAMGVHSKPVKMNQNFSSQAFNMQLNRFCNNCQETSLARFIGVMNDIETAIESTTEIKVLQQYQLLLIKAYYHLAFKFYKNEDSKREDLMVKQIQLLDKTVDSLQEKALLEQAKKSVDDTFHQLLRTYKDNPQLFKSWEMKFTPVRKKLYNKVKMLKEAESQKLNIVDLSLLEFNQQQVMQMIKTLANIKPGRSKELKSYTKELANVLLKLIRNNKIPQTSILNLKRAAIELHSYHFQQFKKTNTLDDIIWWSHVRSLKKESGLKLFLNNQIHSKRNEDASRLLIELGKMHDY